MNLQERIEVLVELGRQLKDKDDFLDALMQRTYHKNKWFTVKDQQQAIENITTNFLTQKALENWAAAYNIQEKNQQNIGLVLADSTPLAGFHDILSVFITGHHAQIKLPENDEYVLPYLIKLLSKINPATTTYFSVVPKLQKFDAVIATGNNRATRYLETYFKKYPNIIRNIRKGVAVLSGFETQDELIALGKDVFQNFGLGARNVAKLYVPKNYPFEPLLEALHEYRDIVLNDKYKNNFDYHYAIYIINRAKYLANGCIMLKEEETVLSPIANLHYEYYEDIENVLQSIQKQAKDIELIASQLSLKDLSTIPFGQTQQPSLFDYANGIDTMKFLTSDFI